MNWILELLQEVFDDFVDSDELIDQLQEIEPAELKEICANLWALELVVSYCKARNE